MRDCVCVFCILALYVTSPVPSQAIRTTSDGVDSSDVWPTSSDVDPTSDGADSSGDWPAHSCSGRGFAYCDTHAVKETECPQACLDCKEVAESEATSDMSSIADVGVYDYVYVLDDVGLCLSTCNDIAGAECVDWDRHKGKRFCKAVTCTGTTIEGCHGRGDFATPTCETCDKVFPNACKTGRKWGWFTWVANPWRG